MHHSVIVGSLLLGLGLLGLGCVAEGEPTDEPVAVTEENLGYEDPYPAPGWLPGGGHDLGGPGNGWAGGWANDPQYAAYTKPRDPDPYKAQRDAQQRKDDRIREENRAPQGPWPRPLGRTYPRFYAGGFSIPAPPAPRWTSGPLNDKGRCVERCFEKYEEDSAYCRRLPESQRHRCWEKASEDYVLCVRECSRKYPDPRLPKDD